MKLILGVIVFLMLVGVGNAAVIVGVSPGTLDYKNVLRNGYAERFTTITIDSDEFVGVNLTANGDIAQWLNFTQFTTVKRDQPARILVSVSPPSDIPNGNYSGYIRVSTMALSQIDGGENSATAAVRAVIDIVVSIEITDIEILQCSSSGFTVRTVEKGDDIVFFGNTLNSGNIRLKPTFIANIWDQEQITLIKTEEYKASEILPTKGESFEFRMSSNDLELGQYWAEVEVPECSAKEVLTFDVLEPGSLKSEGILIRMEAKNINEVGDTIAITADFENTGEKDYDARFRGQITLDDEIVQVIEGEPESVKVGEINEFVFYYTPKKVGKYVASGRVFYDRKRTFESSVPFNVYAKSIGIKQILTWLGYVVIMFIIAFLLYRIRKEKRKYLGKISR